MTYVDGLKYLCLNSLELQGLHTDLAKMFKIAVSVYLKFW